MESHIIVAQPRVDGSALLSVGVLPWTHAGPRIEGEDAQQLTFIVKAAFSYAPGPDGETPDPAVIIEPPPLRVDQPSALPGADEEDELAYPSDFVLRKVMAEVLLTGHAYAELPSARLGASFKLGPAERLFSAVAGGVARRLPLAAAYLRTVDGTRAVDPVGPVERVPFLVELPEDLDYGYHQSAVDAQQLDEIEPGPVIEMSGLSPRAPEITVRLPAVQPRAVASFIDGEDRPIPLSLDTIVIDTDAEQVTAVWRGASSVSSAAAVSEIERLDVWLDPVDAPRDLASVRRDLLRGVYAHAIEVNHDGSALAVLPEPLPEDLLAAKYALWDQAPEPALPLERFALISAELMEERERRADTLLRHQLDDEQWTLEERAWLEKMGAASNEGDAGPAERFGALFIAAQDTLAGPHEASRTLDDYVRVRAAVERGADTHASVTFFEMTMPEWLRLDRRFAAEAAADPALMREIERRVREEPVDPRLLVDPDDDFASDEDDEDEEDDA